MRKKIRPWMGLWSLALLAGVSCWVPSRAATPTDESASTEIVNSVWQKHKMSFDYIGFTSLYTCDGLQEHLRQILRHLGARKDLHVAATGCLGPSYEPSSTAWVKADFYTLAPSADAAGADAVKARWSAFELSPRRPSVVGEGDCELIQGMKDLITKNFSLRGVEYRTDCVPHEVTLDSFTVKGQVLRELTRNSRGEKGSR